VKIGDIYDYEQIYNIYAVVNTTPNYNSEKGSDGLFIVKALPDVLKYTLEIYRVAP